MRLIKNLTKKKSSVVLGLEARQKQVEEAENDLADIEHQLVYGNKMLRIAKEKEAIFGDTDGPPERKLQTMNHVKCLLNVLRNRTEEEVAVKTFLAIWREVSHSEQPGPSSQTARSDDYLSSGKRKRESSEGLQAKHCLFFVYFVYNFDKFISYL